MRRLCKKVPVLPVLRLVLIRISSSKWHEENALISRVNKADRQRQRVLRGSYHRRAVPFVSLPEFACRVAAALFTGHVNVPSTVNSSCPLQSPRAHHRRGRPSSVPYFISIVGLGESTATVVRPRRYQPCACGAERRRRRRTCRPLPNLTGPPHDSVLPGKG